MANSESNSVDILVLGPMVQTTEQGELVAPSRTEAVKKVIEGIVGEITAGDPTLKVNVAAPEDADTPLIVPGVLNAIEKADLVVIDLTGDKPNVAYEAGIVHALGLPHLFVTGDPKPPFYFRPVQHIANLKAQDGYRREDKIHQRLRDRIRDFVAPGTVIQAMNFTDNELTQYYGLPIVDVAGPSGLAAGYFRNAVRRFVRKGGFLNVPCDVSYRTRSLGPGSAEASITTKLTIGHMIAIRPSGELARTHNADVGALAQELEKLGLRTKDVTIPKRDGDYEDMRNFGGQLLAHAGAESDPVRFVEPGILIDIPTTLYALQFSPRVRRLNKSGASSEFVNARKLLLLRQMRESFERNLRYQLNEEADSGGNAPFDFVSLAELPGLLKKLGVEVE